jgi:hypothetical protein
MGTGLAVHVLAAHGLDWSWSELVMSCAANGMSLEWTELIMGRPQHGLGCRISWACLGMGLAWACLGMVRAKHVVCIS